MRKIIIVLFLMLFISINLNAKFFRDIRLATSFSARSSNVQGKKFDYEIAFEFEKENFIYVELEKERESGKDFYNQEFKLTQRYKFIVVNGKWLKINSDDLDLKSISVRFSYKNWNCGIAQQWENNLPATKFVIGKSIKSKLWKIFTFELQSDFLTSDLKNWNYETMSKLSFDVYLFDMFYRITIRDYGLLNWQTKFGIELNI